MGLHGEFWGLMSSLNRVDRLPRHCCIPQTSPALALGCSTVGLVPPAQVGTVTPANLGTEPATRVR